MFRRFIISFAIFCSVLAPVLAADPPPLIGGDILPGTDNSDIEKVGSELDANEGVNWIRDTLIMNIVSKLIGWTAALAVVFLIIGGYQYLTAASNEEQVKKAHKTIIWSLAGVLISLLAFSIIQIVTNINFGSANLLRADMSESIGQIVPSSEWAKESEDLTTIESLPTGDFRNNFLPIVTRFLIYGMGIVSFMVFFLSGSWLVLGWGEEDSIKKAKSIIVWGVAGLVITAASYTLVKGLLGIDFTSMCGDGIKEGQEQCDGSDLGSKSTEDYKCSDDCKLLMKCLELDEDGLLGPDTDKARKETPNLAATFTEDDKADCRDASKLETVDEMPIRQSGDPECLPVLDFQEAYNNLVCDEKTGKKIDQ